MSKIIGAALLIVACGVGAGMLLLPAILADANLISVIMYLVFAWSITLISGFYIIEVNQWFPEGTNLVGMARATLGKTAAIFTSIIYFFVTFALCVTYTIGGAELTQNLFKFEGLSLPLSISTILFVSILSTIVYVGIRTADLVNRGLMFFKIGAFVLLVLLLLPHAHITSMNIPHHAFSLPPVVIILIVSFTYATIIPSLRTYFNSDISALKKAVFLGNTALLVIYIIWCTIIFETISVTGNSGLEMIAASKDALAQFTNSLIAITHQSIVAQIVTFFTIFCLLTAFLATVVVLFDMFPDSVKFKHWQAKRWHAAPFVLVPIILLALIFQHTFLKALNIAGTLTITLTILLPGLFVLSGRYIKRINQGYRLPGGLLPIIYILLASISVLAIHYIPNTVFY